MLDRSIAPPIHPIKPFDFVKPTTTILSNGIKLHTVNAGIQPIVSLQLVFPTLPTFPNVEVCSEFTARMLLEGTTQKTNEQIAEMIANHGAYLDSDSGLDFANLELYCLTKYLPQLTDLLIEMLTDSVFPESGLTHIRNVTYQQQKVNFERTQVVASFKFREALFGKNNPYGKHKTLENIQKVTQDEIVTYYQKVYKNCPFELIMAGNFSDQDLQNVENSFGKLYLNSCTDTIPENLYQVPELTEKNITENKEKAVQTSVRMGRELFTRTHPNYRKFSVLNTVFGGYFGSRLMANIREDKGYTYGIYSSVVPMKNAGYMVIGGDTQKEFRDETIAEILKEMELLRQELVSENELNTVKNYICGNFVKSLKNPLEIAAKYRSVYFYGLSADYFSNYIADIQAVTAQDLLEMAQKYFQEKDFLTVLIG